MKKHSISRPLPYRVPSKDAERFHGSIFTIIYNLAALMAYAIFLRFSIDGALVLILFSVIAILQLIVCAVIGFNYNSKIWLISALMIFLIVCAAIVYESI